MISIAVAHYVDQAQRLGQLMDSLEVVCATMDADADSTAALKHHRNTIKELKDKIMDLSPLVDKILEDIEDL